MTRLPTKVITLLGIIPYKLRIIRAFFPMGKLIIASYVPRKEAWANVFKDFTLFWCWSVMSVTKMKVKDINLLKTEHMLYLGGGF